MSRRVLTTALPTTSVSVSTSTTRATLSSAGRTPTETTTILSTVNREPTVTSASSNAQVAFLVFFSDFRSRFIHLLVYGLDREMSTQPTLSCGVWPIYLYLRLLALTEREKKNYLPGNKRKKSNISIIQ